MIRTIVSCMLLATVAIFGTVGCGEDGGPSATADDGVNGISLLGLVDGRTLTYLQTDTVISFAPAFEISDTTFQRSFRIGGEGDDWTILAEDEPTISLKISQQSILINGNWSLTLGSDVLHYFSTPSPLMPRSIAKGAAWSGFTPAYQTAGDPSILPIYYANFGFYFQKRYVGEESLVLPAGEIQAHRFDLSLYLEESDSIPIALTEEYYSPGVGLVLLKFEGASLRSSLSLIDYVDAR